MGSNPNCAGPQTAPVKIISVFRTVVITLHSDIFQLDFLCRNLKSLGTG